MIEIKTSFSADITAALQKLTAATGEATLRATGYAGAKVFLDEAKRRVPVDTGTIRDNIIVKRAEEKSDGAKLQTYLVTVRSGKYGRNGDAFYWRFVENGHSYVRRNPKSGKGANWKAHREASRVEYGSSSAPAQPFMRPAYESKKEDAMQAMRERLAERIKYFLNGGEE